jgi:hypothetical protein
MPKLIEVDEEQWNLLQNRDKVLRHIASVPAAARLMEQAHKTAQPTVSTPLADADKAANEPLMALRKEFEDYKKGVEDERAKDQEERSKGLLKTKWEAGQKMMLDNGYTPEGIKKIEDEIMIPKGLTDHKDAMRLWELDHPPAPLATPGTGPWNFLEQPKDKPDESIKTLIESRGANEMVADRMAREALSEFRQQVAQASGRR